MPQLEGAMHILYGSIIRGHPENVFYAKSQKIDFQTKSDSQGF